MAGELPRGLVLGGIGLAAGFALIVALLGPAELAKRAVSVMGSPQAPSTAGKPEPAEADPSGKPVGEGERNADAPSEPARSERKAAIPTLEQPQSEGRSKENAKEAQKPADDRSANAPSLDIVRVEPNGDAVIAGRTAPNASVEILRDDRPIARAKADASGNFAIVPPTLPTGNSEISYRSVAPDGRETRGKESVAVVVAENRTTKPLVAVSTPDKPTQVLSQPEAPAEPKAQVAARDRPGDKPEASVARKDRAGDAKPPQRLSALPEAPGEPRAHTGGSAEGVPVKIVSIDAQEGGRLDVTGIARTGATLRLYLNDTMVASGRAGVDGRLAFTIGRGVRAGGYQIRIDQVDPATGKVEHRAQVAFAFPEAAAAPKLAAREPASAAAPPPPMPAKPDADRTPPGELAARQAVPKDGGVAAKPGSPAPDPRAAQAPASGRKPETAQPALASPPTAPQNGRVAANPNSPAPEPSRAAQAPPSERRPETAQPVPASPSTDAPSRTEPRAQQQAARGSGAKPAPTMTLPQPQAQPSGLEKTEPRAAAETPAAAAAGKPGASPAPTPDSDRRTAQALAPRLPEMAGSDSPEPKRAESATTDAPAAAPPTPDAAGTVFVPEIATAKITRGDNLWQISRRSYGSGIRYTVIFDANKDQIKDPDRIYPGQIFVLPKDDGPSKRG